MYEIRFHGRGGQGAVVASIVLASAFFKEGKFVQAFPSFGAERRGAPVVAFTRVSDQEIRERFGIYEPDCLIILDSSLTRREGHCVRPERGPLDHYQQRQETRGLSFSGPLSGGNTGCQLHRTEARPGKFVRAHCQYDDPGCVLEGHRRRSLSNRSWMPSGRMSPSKPENNAKQPGGYQAVPYNRRSGVR